jgi:hypothetical protein
VNAEPPPLRWGATVAAIILATAVGGLLMGSCAYAIQTVGLNDAPVVVIAGFLGAWALTAAFIYAANQQWIGRSGGERAERVVLCLVIALPIQFAVVTVAVNVLERLGGHL